MSAPTSRRAAPPAWATEAQRRWWLRHDTRHMLDAIRLGFAQEAARLARKVAHLARQLEAERGPR